MSRKSIYSYTEVLHLIADAEKRREEVTTEYEFEMIEAELEELYAEREMHEFANSDFQPA